MMYVVLCWLLCHRPGGIKRWCCLTSVCLSRWTWVSRYQNVSHSGFYWRWRRCGINWSYIRRLSDVCLSDVCGVHPVSVRRVRPAGSMTRIGWSGPARPAWFKAAAARFRCRPGREHIAAAAHLQLVWLWRDVIWWSYLNMRSKAGTLIGNHIDIGSIRVGSDDLEWPLTRVSRPEVEYLKKRCVLGTKLLQITNRKPYPTYRMVPLS